MTAIRVRPLVNADLAACQVISDAASPAHPVDLSEPWNGQRYHRSRYVAEEEGGKLLAWGEIAHIPWNYHPHKYGLRLEVDPEHRRLGIGSLLLERLLEELRGREAWLVRTAAFEGDTETIDFLTRRGFREVWRELESRLDLAQFDPTSFAAAAERSEREGVSITTLPDELAAGQGVLSELYELYDICNKGQEELDPVTVPSFEEFVAGVVHGPKAVPESWFLARVGGKLVGLSTLERLNGGTAALEAGYTAVHPAYRGRGIALALKLRTIAFAASHGYAFIHTGSSYVNTRMLAINAALGFRPQPARITYELALS